MVAKSLNQNLHKANQAKKDEFYTQLIDIEKELKHYKEQFHGKIVYCNGIVRDWSNNSYINNVTAKLFQSVISEGASDVFLFEHKKYLHFVSGRQNDITFLDSIKRKLNLYQKAWVFMNPSLIEGWGITSIEANACGTPVVASNVPGLRDSVRNPHTGFLVTYGDVDGFVNKITLLLENKSLRKKQENKKAILYVPVLFMLLSGFIAFLLSCFLNNVYVTIP